MEETPPNTWVLLDEEGPGGGKTFAEGVVAGSPPGIYLWGTGGEKPARNVYRRYELERFAPDAPGWKPAFPEPKRDEWTATDFPPFRIWGQTGPDGLHWDEGPRLQVVGGYHSTNRIRWWSFDGVRRPSPVLTHRMACVDTRRDRVIYYSDGVTFALDPATRTWTELDAANHPTTCRALAWASLAYDRTADQLLLFGGGLATNPEGGAPTWIYDLTANRWERPELEREPPLRCNGALVHDPSSSTTVLFGGYDQAAARNDTWVWDGAARRWEERTPSPSPPPMFAPAAALVPGGGRVLVCGHDARKVRRGHRASTSAVKETWVYDIAEDRWTPVDGRLELEGYRWLTAASSGELERVFLVAFGPRRRTYALRHAADAGAAELPGAPPGTVAWKYPEQKESLEQAPAPQPEEHAERLASLPPNEFVAADPPSLLISKTWSTAVIDTHRSQVLYLGGGHSGYSGNDIARYDIATNRWSLDFPPRFPPFLEGTNAGIFGWSYGRMPFSQHTYLWYDYDPASRTLVYLARPSLRDGIEVQPGDDPEHTFVYDATKHGYATWVYDPAAKRMHPPSFGRPFANPWHLAVAGTPRGVYAMCKGQLYRGEIDRERGAAEWTLVDGDFPEPREEIEYHYEFQPLLHDTRRDRLLLLKGDEERVDVFARPFGAEAAWRQLETTGAAAIGREAVYIERHDTVLWLGDRRLYALDCAEERLRELDLDLPEGLYTHECALVYDPRHDVCVALIPARFSGPMQTFLFRYAPGAAAER